MIEINLSPGARRSKRSKRPALALPRLGGGARLDRWGVWAVVGWVVGPGLILWLHLSTSSRREELNLAIEQGVQDSTRLAKLIESQARLRARRDTVAQKLQLIQEIDAGRYIWAHILDEIGRALPDYVWLTEIANVDNDQPLPSFNIAGRAGNTFALTRFMKELEASPFIREVNLTSTELVTEGEGHLVYQFALVASYEEPPPELVETVPLFAGED